MILLIAIVGTLEILKPLITRVLVVWNGGAGGNNPNYKYLFKSISYIDILFQLPPKLPPYDLGKLGNKTLVPLQNIVAEIGVGGL